MTWQLVFPDATKETLNVRLRLKPVESTTPATSTTSTTSTKAATPATSTTPAVYRIVELEGAS